ncbi:trimethylamine methyltransferase family protein [bacterium]|nr:trimethylamine methyltransferase family protein [bacterium]
MRHRASGSPIITYQKGVLQMGLKMLEVLSENELKRIHEASLRGLSETGMKIRSRKALELLGDSGASVDLER